MRGAISTSYFRGSALFHLTLPVIAQRPPRPALSPAFFLIIKLSVEPPFGTVLTGGTHDDLCLAQHSHHSTLPYLVEAEVSRH